jgi:hypothetical protein
LEKVKNMLSLPKAKRSKAKRSKAKRSKAKRSKAEGVPNMYTFVSIKLDEVKGLFYPIQVLSCKITCWAVNRFYCFI